MPETAPGLPLSGCYLGFDFGLKRIGVASGNTVSVTAMPLITVNNNQGIPDWVAIDKLMTEWQPVGLVVGLPVQLDGSPQEMTAQATGFIRQLKRRFQIPVYPTDERMSSMEASAIIKKNRQSGASGKTQKRDVDKIAATVLLQRWLENQ